MPVFPTAPDASAASPTESPAGGSVPAPCGSGSADARLHVRLLWLPEAMPGTIFSTLDVLAVADGIARLQQPNQPSGLSWEVVGPTGDAAPMHGLVPASPAMTLRDDGHVTQSLLMLPGLRARNTPHLADIVEREPAALRLVSQHLAGGGWLAASYNGIALPARAGALDAGRIAAPWFLQSWMARRHPRTDFSAEDPIGLHRRIFYCIAPALQTEFALHVLGHLHDASLATAVARVMLHQPERQQLTPDLIAQRWVTPPADSPVYRARRWLQSNIDRPYKLADVARAAAVSERTLLRHFREVTGLTPLDYLHSLRVERAKTMLEVTLHGTQAIAEACGYTDAAAFRKVFLRATGLSMSEYRDRYALRANRRYWKVERG